MGDNVRDEFDGNDSEEDIEKPPTPQFRHGGGDGESSPRDEPDDVSDTENNDGSERVKDKSDSLNESVSGTRAEEEENDFSNTTSSTSVEGPRELSPSTLSKTGEDLESGEDLGNVQKKEDVDVPVEKSAELTHDVNSSDDINMELDNKDEGRQEEPAGSASLGESLAKLEKSSEKPSHVEEKADDARLRRFSATSAGTGTEDEDLEMPMSPIGDLGLTGMEAEIVDDILKGDVNEFLPGGNKEVKQSEELHDADQSADEEVKGKPKDEEKDEEKEDEKEKEAAATASHSGTADQDGEGSDQGEEGGDQLIADIFGASDEEEEFEGFGQADIEVTKKKKGARDQKKKPVSMVSDDEDESKEDEISTKSLTVPKPTKDSDSEDSGEDRPVFVSDFDEMMKKKKETNRGNRRRRRDYDIISDSDDLIVSLINQMKEAAEEDKLLNGAKQAATKKLKLYPSVSRQLNKVDLQTTFLDCGVLPILKEWLSPLPDGSLPHLQIREGLLKLLTHFPRLDTGALKVSGLGKAVMYLYRHPKETRVNKGMAGKLINEWARPIFGVTANFKSLSREEREKRDYQNMSKRRRLSSTDLDGGKTPKSIDSALQGDKKALRPGDKGFIMRARVPVPSNKEYVVRPKSSLEAADFIRTQAGSGKAALTRYDKQLRKFKDKKKNSKMQKAVGISLEGRKMAL